MFISRMGDGKKRHVILSHRWRWMAAADHPTSPVAWHELGVAYIQKERFSDAQEAFARALELRPAYTDAAFHMALVAFRTTDVRQQVPVQVESYVFQ